MLTKKGASWGILFFTIIVAFLGLLIAIPKAQPIMGFGSTTTTLTETKEVIQYVAIGDSLTEGIGDSTNSGGFVPLLAKELQETYNLNGVQTENFGKNGDRSDQIVKRITANEDIQTGLASADIITLTVGGNDLMKVIKGDIFNLTKDSFTTPLATYQKELEKLFSELREYNATAPIYVLGIYNPFYLYFPEFTDMQEIVDTWNAGTESIVAAQENAYFIPINDLLYKGSGGEVGIVSSTTTDSSTTSSSEDKNTTNDALYEADHFHPNNLGYQIIASAMRDKIEETQDKWLKTEKDE